MNIRALLAFVSICFVNGAAYAQTPLRVIVFPGGANLPLWVAQEKGLFAHEGVAVKITPTPNSVFLIQSLMKGEQDIALSVELVLSFTHQLHPGRHGMFRKGIHVIDLDGHRNRRVAQCFSAEAASLGPLAGKRPLEEGVHPRCDRGSRCARPCGR